MEEQDEITLKEYRRNLFRLHHYRNDLIKIKCLSYFFHNITEADINKLASLSPEWNGVKTDMKPADIADIFLKKVSISARALLLEHAYEKYSMECHEEINSAIKQFSKSPVH